MSNVLYLDRDRLSPLEPETASPENAWISPFSVPESLSISMDGDSYALEFTYPGGETGGSEERVKADDGSLLTILAGKHTRKILTIKVAKTPAALTPPALCRFVAKILKDRASLSATQSQKFSFLMISSVLVVFADSVPEY